ncbi:hypothetical protein Tb11.01.2930 [Trypanosoma brucei brucei TREU927]|uniref:FHA domain-containing protein n=1 Tax=Trypanosoma brucei brucei (strain 927/4 GUTat10.1) TaxID=185431 RepID=Q383G4_TRYB2|nr:hypothetical protein Tb11.01.2930 [Trypanosoma brucei brucei TREU927]EAN80067.1 hypothetical protein Tb11.01.2930 [Trypanosoma brucei brucei TREU927]
MSATSFHFAASGKSIHHLDAVGDVRYCSEQGIVSDILNNIGSGTLVFAIVDNRGDGEELLRMLFTSFADTWGSPLGAWTQFGVSFIDEASCELLQYQCDRHSDIVSIIEDEGAQYRCCSVTASVVEPTSDSFDFLRVTLTLVIWSERSGDKDFLRTAEMVTTAQGIKLGSIFFYFASEDISFVDRCLSMANKLRDVCLTRTLGSNKKRDFDTLLKQVRGWSLFTNEFYRMGPQLEGPYLINLNPRLVVGEKLAHLVSRGVSWIVADGSSASYSDIVVLPLGCGSDGKNPGNVFSPHCSLSYEGETVFIRPECGMTYVNGKFLSCETELQHDDRILLGSGMAFRFVLVTAKEQQEQSPRVVDWESTFKEFEMAAVNVTKEAELRQLNDEVADLREECDQLRLQLQQGSQRSNKAWLVLSNPSDTHAGPCVWDLCWMVDGDSVTLGPGGDISPHLTESAAILRTAEGFVCRSDSGDTELAHLQPFTIGGGVFSLCLQSALVNAKSSAAQSGSSSELARLERERGDDVNEVKRTLYTLQWTIAHLLDFAFPKGKGAADDLNDVADPPIRALVTDYSIYTDGEFTLQGLAAQARTMIEAIQMSMSRMAGEISGVLTPVKRAGGDVRLPETLREGTLGRVKREKYLSCETNEKVANSARRALTDLNSRSKRPHKSTISQLSEEELHARTLDHLSAQVMILKAKCFVAAPLVVRQMSVALQVLSYACDSKIQLKRYIRELDLILEKDPNVVELNECKKRNIALALVDVLVSLNYVMRNCHFTLADRETVDSRLKQWTSIADICIPVISNAESWRHKPNMDPSLMARQRRAPAAVHNTALASAATVNATTTILNTRRTRLQPTTPREVGQTLRSAPPGGQEHVAASYTVHQRRQMLSGTPASTLRKAPAADSVNRGVSKSSFPKHIPVSPRLGAHAKASGKVTPLRLNLATPYQCAVSSPRINSAARSVPPDVSNFNSSRTATMGRSATTGTPLKARKA